MPDIVVIGGGITGVATADALARDGHAVALIEAKRIAAMASGWTLGGVRQSGRDPVELPLARAAVAIWAGLRDTLDADVEYRRNGNLRLARTRSSRHDGARIRRMRSPPQLAPSANDIGNVVALVSHVLSAAARAPIERTWGGLIDLTPDALPVIDAPEAIGGLVVAAGFSGHGFCLGPISGLLCADLALDRRPRLDLSAFRLGRFKDKAIAAAELTLHG